MTSFAKLTGVGYVLKVDPTGVDYTKSLPFSPVLRGEIEPFIRANL